MGGSSRLVGRQLLVRVLLLTRDVLASQLPRAQVARLRWRVVPSVDRTLGGVNRALALSMVEAPVPVVLANRVGRGRVRRRIHLSLRCTNSMGSRATSSFS